MTLCLVTGGAGFIGSHLVESLLAHGYRVRVLDNFSTGNLANLEPVHDQIELVKSDVGDLAAVRAAAKDVEVIFHQATLSSVHRSIIDPLTTHQVCADGTLHILLAAREQRVRRVIYGASASAYGDGGPLPRRETEPVQPISPFAVAKLAGEHYCVAFSYAYGLETVRLRYFNVFGPRQSCGSVYATVIPLLLEAMLAGRRPVIHGDGQQSRDFTYVDDVVQANLLAAEAPRASGKVYNIASGRRTTLLELVDRINALLGTDIKPIHAPPRVGDIRHSFADICRAEADLGYCPCTDLGQCLQACIEYYAAKRKRPKQLRRAAALH
jgi:UDP-glucose 4-epimerase